MAGAASLPCSNRREDEPVTWGAPMASAASLPCSNRRENEPVARGAPIAGAASLPSSNRCEDEPVARALMQIVRHPWDVFVIQWNWKAALLSAGIRGMLFCVAVVPHGAGAMRGAWIEIAFRIALGGCWGSAMQALRRARPAWLAGLLVALLLPACAHTLEFALLKLGGATHIRSGMTVSVAFSAASLLVNFALMRQGLLIVGEGAGSLAADFRQLPSALGLWRRLT